MKCLIFTNNLKKCSELAHLLSPLNLPVFRYTDGFSDPIDVVEDGTSFAENAIKKVEAIAHLKEHILIADDSGLEIEALNGEPGIYSARYGGESLTDTQRCEHVLKQLSASTNRRANFTCVIALKLPNTPIQTIEGKVFGTLSTTLAGSAGFGYDPIFIPDGHALTFAELGPEIKHSISHRARALALAFEYIKNIKGSDPASLKGV